MVHLLPFYIIIAGLVIGSTFTLNKVYYVVMKLELRMKRLENTIRSSSLISHDNAQPASSSLEADIVELVMDGKTIKAVRLYREQTGAGLKDSKLAVEEMIERMILH